MFFNYNFYIFFLRRFIWNFFRLENEHLNNCGEFRAVRDISVVPVPATDDDDNSDDMSTSSPLPYSPLDNLGKNRFTFPSIIASATKNKDKKDTILTLVDENSNNIAN